MQSPPKKSAKWKEILTTLYGLAGMVVFFAVLFYGGSTILELVGLYYKYVFYIGLPIVVVYWVVTKMKR